MNSQLKFTPITFLCTYTFVKSYMFLLIRFEERHYLQQSGAQYVISLPIQLFKILADETRLGIVLRSANWESYASAISALLSTSRAQDLPPPGIAA